jgi:phosphoribosylaminoimidazole-succinocarboxamide synthase
MDSSMRSVKDLINLNLWPKRKKVLDETRALELSDPRLLKINYKIFYEGKNANLYFRPGCASVLMVRTDKASVNDILLSDEIEGKGIIQNQISNLGYDFAEKLGIKTARLYMPKDIPADIAARSQHIQLEKAMEFNLPDGEVTGLELIFRNYLTGSLYKLYKKREDPYGLDLPDGLDEWSHFINPISTPTTKGVSDEPLRYKVVFEVYPREIEILRKLFASYSQFALEKGIVLVDTKFEMFGELLGDEILTPESSRFILLSDFKKGIYKSMDKQILRDYAQEQGWIEKGAKGELLEVTIPDEIKEKVLAGYQKVYDMLAD